MQIKADTVPGAILCGVSAANAFSSITNAGEPHMIAACEDRLRSRRTADAGAALAESLQPLLQALLVQLRRSRETPLQFGIDSEEIVRTTLKQIFAGVAEGDARQWQDWQFATAMLDNLVAQLLRDEQKHHDAEDCAPFLPRPARNEPGGGQGEAQCTLVKAESQLGDPPLLPPGEEREKHLRPLAVWFERFYTVMTEVQPRAIDIVGLRVEGFQDRDIAERLRLGLRLVKRIIQDMRVSWERATGKE